MNKIEIKKFLESEETKTIGSIREKFATDTNNFKQSIINEFEELFGSLISAQNLLEELKHKLDLVHEYFESHETMTYHYSNLYNVRNNVHYILNKGIHHDLKQGMETKHRKETTIKKNETREIELVKEQFRTIRGNISRMSGKEATQYLLNLGFVIPKEIQPKNEVMAPVDINIIKRYRGGK